MIKLIERLIDELDRSEPKGRALTVTEIQKIDVSDKLKELRRLLWTENKN